MSSNDELLPCPYGKESRMKRKTNRILLFGYCKAEWSLSVTRPPTSTFGLRGKLGIFVNIEVADCEDSDSSCKRKAAIPLKRPLAFRDADWAFNDCSLLFITLDAFFDSCTTTLRLSNCDFAVAACLASKLAIGACRI